MMDEAYVTAGWPRQCVSVVPKPSWPLQAPGHAWLLLNGECIPSLADAIRPLSAPGEHLWLRRGTADEYELPGYRAGPLLARANPGLVAQFLDTWGPQQAGLILFGPRDLPALAGQLQRVRRLTAADGNSLAFHWQSLRKLEELGEALALPQLRHLFSPVQRMIWHSGLARDCWLQLAIDDSPDFAPAAPSSLALTSADEAALGSAAHAWFMRRARHEMGQHLQAMGRQTEPSVFHHQLADYDREAGYCGFQHEDDRCYYLQLRLFFPEEPFVKDPAIYNLLLDTEIQGRQRLMEINDRLLEISSPILSR
ncbi:hypothetical protein IAE39_001808 [Pseudomonas sp. S37]|uniref:DUF4123 domain-containing protein n=1 Tax=Pseudomonas sp. S37 TaxID=2767449 RepID=UPI001913345A|nr:DUF4123 domain-containing protein [Pseudomonas sp. S37]MBK4993634.1 hypothetical protein [Pseudomonas sp. S37]